MTEGEIEQKLERLETIVLALECALPNVKYVSASHKTITKLAYEAIEDIKDERLEKQRYKTRELLHCIADKGEHREELNIMEDENL